MSDDTLTVLLVEDNGPDAAYIEELFHEIEWFEVPVGGRKIHETRLHHAETLDDALVILEETIDVVLLDLHLPDVSGIETLETMLAATSTQPVVVLTGLNDEQFGIEAIERGAQDYLVKDDVNATLLGRTIRYGLERQRRERILQRRNEELTLLNRLVRHDIRDDMAVIRGWGEPLLDHVDSDGERDLQRILEASQHVVEMTETVGEFLDTLTHREEPTLRPFELRDVLLNEIDKVESVHKEVTVDVESEIPEVSVAATDLLSSVFRNVLINAIQHNDTDEPRIRSQVNTDSETVTVSIADNGPGIPDHRKDAIFGRTEDGLADPDCGVGLYLVDTLVEMYDGQITVEDNEPRGSVFAIELQRIGPDS